ncbi:MAG TPA: periplasmic heavy metal sensor [Polyangiales bacterium]|jgi:uncharacterized membrane protein|nr:periplasmic heavy metal sensor [Polyangiales bacterium]
MSAVPRRFLILLSASIALNLFLIGAWSARFWMRRDMQGRGDSLSAHAFLRRSGIDENAPNVQAVVQAQRASVRDRMHAVAAARAHVRAALESEPFDPAKLDAALAEVQMRTSEMQRAMHVAVSGVARAVDAEHRRKMADALWPRPFSGARRSHM